MGRACSSGRRSRVEIWSSSPTPSGNGSCCGAGGLERVILLRSAVAADALATPALKALRPPGTADRPWVAAAGRNDDASSDKPRKGEDMRVEWASTGWADRAGSAADRDGPAGVPPRRRSRSSPSTTWRRRRPLAHLLQHDSTYGAWARTVEAARGRLDIDGHEIRVLQQPDPEDLPWEDLGVDVVVEATGKFRTRAAAAAHLRGGARKVVITAPGKDVDATIVMGINEDTYDAAAHDVISNASCTTNCVAPMVKVLHDAFGIERGCMTTVHGYTDDQNLLDGPHKDLRRARSAAVNIIPTSTGAAKAVGLVLPELAGRLDGVALRVPVVDGSLVDLAVLLDRDGTAAEVNAAFADAPPSTAQRASCASPRTPLVSRDVIGDPASCVFDTGLDPGSPVAWSRSSAGTTTSGATPSAPSTSSRWSPGCCLPAEATARAVGPVDSGRPPLPPDRHADDADGHSLRAGKDPPCRTVRSSSASTAPPPRCAPSPRPPTRHGCGSARCGSSTPPRAPAPAAVAGDHDRSQLW